MCGVLCPWCVSASAAQPLHGAVCSWCVRQQQSRCMVWCVLHALNPTEAPTITIGFQPMSGSLPVILVCARLQKKAVHELARQWSKKRLERLLASPDPTRITPLLEMDDLTKPHPGIEGKCGGFSKDPTRFHDSLFHCNTVFDKMKAAPGQLPLTRISSVPCLIHAL